MAVIETTDTTSVPGSGGGGQNGISASGAGANGVVILQYELPKILVKEGYEWL